MKKIKSTIWKNKYENGMLVVFQQDERLGAGKIVSAEYNSISNDRLGGWELHITCSCCNKDIRVLTGDIGEGWATPIDEYGDPL